jgi:hypothetical protein
MRNRLLCLIVAGMIFPVFTALSFAQDVYRPKKDRGQMQECIKRCEDYLISQGFQKDSPGFPSRFKRCKRDCRQR